jgi:hypothetical protein
MNNKKPKIDHAYIMARDTLIPIAEMMTNQTIGYATKSNRKEWSKTFLKNMDDLAREKGLIE